jgi:hypothetical protein
MKMIDFLTEGNIQTNKKVGGNPAGIIHELLFGYCMRVAMKKNMLLDNMEEDMKKFDPRDPKNANLHMPKFRNEVGQSPVEAFMELQEHFDDENFEYLFYRARLASVERLKYYNENDLAMTEHYWTSKANQITELTGVPTSQNEDDGDTVSVLQDSQGNIIYDTISAKAYATGKKDITSQNSGIIPTGPMGPILQEYKKKQQALLKGRGGTNTKSRKQFYKEHPIIAKKAEAIYNEFVPKFRDHFVKEFKKLQNNPEAFSKKLRQWLHAHPTPLQKANMGIHAQVIVLGFGDKTEVKTVDPATDYEQILGTIAAMDPKELKKRVKLREMGQSGAIVAMDGHSVVKTTFKAKSKSDFLGPWGHLFNTPLLQIQALAKNLKEDEQEPIVHNEVPKPKPEPKVISGEFAGGGMDSDYYYQEREYDRKRNDKEALPELVKLASKPIPLFGERPQQPEQEQQPQQQGQPEQKPNPVKQGLVQKMKGALNKVTGGKKTDWAAIRRAYEMGNTSLEKLGQQYGVNPNSIGWRKGVEKWKRPQR